MWNPESFGSTAERDNAQAAQMAAIASGQPPPFAQMPAWVPVVEVAGAATEVDSRAADILSGVANYTAKQNASVDNPVLASAQKAYAPVLTPKDQVVAMVPTEITRPTEIKAWVDNYMKNDIVTQTEQSGMNYVAPITLDYRGKNYTVSGDAWFSKKAPQAALDGRESILQNMGTSYLEADRTRKRKESQGALRTAVGVMASVAGGAGLFNLAGTGAAAVGTTGSAVADAAINGAVSGGVSGGIATGNPVKGMLTGAIGGGFAAGGGLTGLTGVSTGSKVADSLVNSTAAGGLKAGLSGGDVLKGLVSGGVGGLVKVGSSFIPSTGSKVLDGLLASTVSGGVKSGLTGGSVTDGLIAGGLNGAVNGVTSFFPKTGSAYLDSFLQSNLRGAIKRRV